MLKWLGYAAFLIVGLIVWGLAGTIGKLAGRSAIEQYQQGRISGIIEAAQEQAARELRKKLPARIDDITTMVSILSNGNEIIYIHKIDYDIADINKSAFIDGVSRMLITNVCAHKAMSEAIKVGAVYTYSYVSRDGFLIGSTTISKQECGGM